AYVVGRSLVVVRGLWRGWLLFSIAVSTHPKPLHSFPTPRSSGLGAPRIYRVRSANRIFFFTGGVVKICPAGWGRGGWDMGLALRAGGDGGRFRSLARGVLRIPPAASPPGGEVAGSTGAGGAGWVF